VAEQQDAKKQRLGPEDALRLARAASHLIVAKGQNVVRVNVQRDDPSDKELKKLLLGPSGNLRAPTMRVGRKLYVGFAGGEFAAELLG
jgi:hypothetical protein